MLSVHFTLVEPNKRLVVHELDPRADSVKNGGANALLELPLTLSACNDVKANPKILKLGELNQRAVEVSGVFNLEVGVWE